MDAIKAAVIGVGALGRHHARILANMDGVELVAVADTNIGAARQIADQHGCEATTNYRELLGRVDAISIAAPTILHQKIAIDCLNAGVPILVEKPLAAKIDAARAIIERAEQTGLVLAVGHVERFNPAYQTMRELAGRPRYIRTERVSPFAFRSTDIGAVHDLMIHDLDLVLDLTGSRVARVEAFGASLLGRQEDVATARLGFENGCVADLVVNRVNPVAGRTIQVWSETGCTSADLTSRQVDRVAPSDELRRGGGPLTRATRPGARIEQLKQEMFTRDFVCETAEVSDADALTAELTDFVDCCRTGARPRVGGPEALAALAVADRVLTCIDRHQWDGHAEGLTGPMAWWPTPMDVPRRKAA